MRLVSLCPFALPVILGLSLAACSSSGKKADAPAVAAAATPIPLPQTLREAVDSSFRTPTNRDRDMYRHPLETLTFFDIQPEMTVVEITPSTGWYTEILAPFLAAKGHYIAATNPASNAEGDEHAKQLKSWMDAHPEVAQKITFSGFAPPKVLDIAPAGTADRVLTFRNVHNWMKGHSHTAVFAAFFKALKPGGMLGIVEHRAAVKAKYDAEASSGYVPEKDVIKFAKKAGFKLVEKSEINANPKDTKDYPEGVWTLPPSYRLGDQDHEKYSQIGESDRMTMKFVKPAKK